MAPNNIGDLKDKVRKEIQEKLRGQVPLLRDKRSRKIQEELLSREEFISAKTVMSYVATSTEVDTRYLNKKTLEDGKRLVVPFISTENQTIIASELGSIDDLVKGPFGLLAPKNGLETRVPLKEIDLIVVPAIAYDRKNRRLGRGEGYYDRFLASGELSSAKTIGLAFHFQVVDSLPSDSHDKPVTLVITD